MGFLHKLWDETLAGPPPENGLGKLRKYNSFSAARSSFASVSSPPTTPVSRSITVLRTNSTNARNVNVSAGSGSQPSSPAGSSTPGSPFSLGGPSTSTLEKHTVSRESAPKSANLVPGATEKKEDPTNEENDMLDLAFGLTETLVLTGLSSDCKTRT
ncbi:hypothetical protein RJ639_045262 [Escallonia herrerae]|uniref:Dormancy-associated protein homolog 4 n=1 Tax=Escallonia herrerae TaxID=1293975 RepID=A0AA89B0V6_9ASTE|nr:hypothetical protein RJ639_045262 [Escallonia herrerae]